MNLQRRRFRSSVLSCVLLHGIVGAAALPSLAAEPALYVRSADVVDAGLEVPAGELHRPGISPDGQRIAHIHDGALVISDGSLRELERRAFNQRPSRLVFTRDNKLLLIGDEMGTLWCFSVNPLKKEWSTQVDPKRVCGLDISEDKKLVAASGSQAVTVVGLKSGRKRSSRPSEGTTLIVGGHPLIRGVFVRNGKQLAIVEKKRVRFVSPTSDRGRSKDVPFAAADENALNAVSVGDKVLVATFHNFHLVGPSGRPKSVKISGRQWVYYFHPLSDGRLGVQNHNGQLVATHLKTLDKPPPLLHSGFTDYSAASPVGNFVYELVKRDAALALRRVRFESSRDAHPLKAWLTTARAASHYRTFHVGFSPRGTPFRLRFNYSEEAEEATGANTATIVDTRGPFTVSEARLVDNAMQEVYTTTLYRPWLITPYRIIGAQKGKKTLRWIERRNGNLKEFNADGELPVGVSQNGAFLLSRALKKGSPYHVWDVDKSEKLGTVKAKSGRFLAVTSEGANVLRYDGKGTLECLAPEGKVRWSAPASEPVSRVSLTYDDHYTLCGNALYDTSSGEKHVTIGASGTLSPDGKLLLVAASDEKPGHFVDCASGEEAGVLADADPRLEPVSLSRDGRWLFVRKAGSELSAEHYIYERQEAR